MWTSPSRSRAAQSPSPSCVTTRHHHGRRRVSPPPQRSPRQHPPLRLRRHPPLRPSRGPSRRNPVYRRPAADGTVPGNSEGPSDPAGPLVCLLKHHGFRCKNLGGLTIIHHDDERRCDGTAVYWLFCGFCNFTVVPPQKLKPLMITVPFDPSPWAFLLMATPAMILVLWSMTLTPGGT